ncbi:ferredoxin--NADP reductase [Robertkochia aurantiaca]|uniref:ferredoxin--NADP reductase n=1 Tax=Robertkochia aurantiaca TaxID=2873700 RepID=UPI001CCB2A33|nr:ferredoxin--NADP reductase [Robertkochia sp. 3YJGBD-33]
MPEFFPLEIGVVENITPNSVSLTFKIPEDKKEAFRFKPGQYITLKTNINGAEVRRSYSICSAADDPGITVGVKKVADGTFSVYANEELSAGSEIEVHPPEGRFTFDAANDPGNTVVAFAAGSGITPVMSIMKAVLKDTDRDFILVYGNKTLEETMFYKDIMSLKERYGNRLEIQFLYSRTQENDAIFGRIERSTVNYILKNKLDSAGDAVFYLCGPEGMINNVSETLKEKGVASDRIKFELFSSDDSGEAPSDVPEGKTQVKVTVDDEEFTLLMDRKKRVLDAVLDNDIDAPYSCQGGICSSCIARVKKGKAEMVKNQILTDSEVQEGLILTCQSHPLSSELEIDYDDV